MATRFMRNSAFPGPPRKMGPGDPAVLLFCARCQTQLGRFPKSWLHFTDSGFFVPTAEPLELTLERADGEMILARMDGIKF